MPQAVHLEPIEAEFPFFGTEHRRTGGTFGVGTARRLGREDFAPFEVIAVGDIALRFDHPADGMDGMESCGGGRDFEDDRVGAVADGHQQDAIAGFGGGQDGSEHQGGVGGAGLADGQGEAIGDL